MFMKRRWFIDLCSSLLLVIVFALSSPAFGQTCLSGTWHGDWQWTRCPPDFICSIGTVYPNIDMNLTQTGSQVTGTYSNDNRNRLTGTVADTSFTFRVDYTGTLGLFDLCSAQVVGNQLTDGTCTSFYPRGIGSYIFFATRQTSTCKPVIDPPLDPVAGAVGDLVTITGQNFGTPQGTSTVRFSSPLVPLSALVPQQDIVSWSDTKIVIQVPDLVAGVYDVTVTTSLGQSNAVQFEVLGDLSVDKVLIAQLVFDPDFIKNGKSAPDFNKDGKIDLVLGKETVILATVSATGYSPVELRSVDVNATLCGTEVARATLILAGLASQDSTVKLPFTPSTAGSCDEGLVVTINPDCQIKEADSANDTNDCKNDTNNSKSVPVQVWDTQNLFVAYVRVECYGDQLTQDEYDDTVSKADAYLSMLYPIVPSKLKSQKIDVPFTDCTGNGQTDANLLWLGARLATSFRATRVVGIVGKKWFSTNYPSRPNAHGVDPSCGHTVFVRNGRWDTVSHEIGHSYGLNHPDLTPFDLLFPQHICKEIPPGPFETFFWDVQIQQVRRVDSIMTGGGESPPLFLSPDRWFTKRDYEWVFSITTSPTPPDPEILLVSGIVSENGQVEFAPFYRVPEGIVDVPPFVGDFAISVLDAARQVLYSQSFDVRFVDMTDPPIATDTAFFGLGVSYPPTAAIVQVQRSGQVLAEVRVTTKLVHDAVASIPDAGFTQNPAQRRNALFNKINALDKQLATGALSGARNNLQNDIRKSLNDWLLNGYTTQSPLEYTKEAILALVDELLQRRPLFSDINEDGKVDCSDLAIVKASFGKRTGQLGFDPRADTNNDGVVNVKDLAFVSQQLPAGTRCR